jgi:hypothetical protein
MILNRKRLREWRLVLKLEGRKVGWWSVFRDIAHALLLALFDRKRTRLRWFKRMRACYRCRLIFDPELKRCAPYTESKLGCHCYAPFKGVIQPGANCWLNDNLPDHEGGWSPKPKAPVSP